MPAEIAEALAALPQAGRRRSPRSSRLRSADELAAVSSATAASCATATTPALDETRALRDESRRVVAALQARYADETGVRALKIRHNNVLGYFVEVTAQHGEKLLAPPLNATFIHRQTLAGQVRFTTTELGELEAKIASAADRALGIELEIFEKLAGAVIAAGAEPIKAPRRGAGRARCRQRRSARSPPSAITCGPQVDDCLAFVDRRRPPSGGRAGAGARRRAVRRQRLRSVAAAGGATPAASGWSPARTWPANRPSCGRTR